MSKAKQGGRPLDDFVSENFTKVGEKNPKTKRWNVQCEFCPSTTCPIEHRDLRCITHVSKSELCPNAPEDTRKEACRLLMMKGGIEKLSDSDSEGEEKETEAGPAKRLKGDGGKVIAVKRGIEGFVDRALTKEEEDKSNVQLLRFFIHGNVPFRAAENPFFLKWLNGLRPSYKPATRYVLTTKYLPAEEARAFAEDLERLEGRENLTYLMDGWEDLLRRSLYGCMLAEVGQYPIVLGLEELTGIRATADNLVDVANKSLKKKNVNPKAIIATCTDNPTTMQAFRRKWTSPGAHHGILPLACFMHGINTILGKITTFPSIKATITKNTRIVSFFNSSHYWGGQLEVIAKDKKVTRGMKTNTESRFYALILQALSVYEHKAALTELCMRDDATRIVRGLTPVAKDVVDTVFDLQRWRLTQQLIRVCKPLVNIIGDVESRDATLADCMLQLIWAHQELENMRPLEGEDAAFLDHAKQMATQQFHAINTDYHWLALFLHPLCRKLAISSSPYSRKLEDTYTISLDIIHRWGWPKAIATKLLQDIKAYFYGEPPFQGGKKDGRDWWKSLLVSASDHPLKALAIKMMSIVPHAAEVECFFSNLGGIHSVKRSRMTVPHLETHGMLRNHYTCQLHEAALSMGKTTRRKHGHMHTQEGQGIDTDRAAILIENLIIPPGAGPSLLSSANGEDAEPVIVLQEDLDTEYEALENVAYTAADGDKHGPQVCVDQVYDITEIAKVRAGDTPSSRIDIVVEQSPLGDSEKWDRDSLLRSLGI